jgi:hypothetical protein
MVDQTKGDSNSLADQLGIHLIVAKQNKLTSIVWQTNLAKIETWQNLADRGCHHRFPVGGREKKEIENREESMM